MAVKKKAATNRPTKKPTPSGTSMYCPSCAQISICRAVPAVEVTDDTDDYQQRRYFKDHDDINWFQRGRTCLNCGASFVTAEVHFPLIEELVQLRNSVRAIKDSAEDSLNEAEAVTKSELAFRFRQLLGYIKSVDRP